MVVGLYNDHPTVVTIYVFSISILLVGTVSEYWRSTTPLSPRNFHLSTPFFRLVGSRYSSDHIRFCRILRKSTRSLYCGLKPGQRILYSKFRYFRLPRLQTFKNLNRKFYGRRYMYMRKICVLSLFCCIFVLVFVILLLRNTFKRITYLRSLSKE